MAAICSAMHLCDLSTEISCQHHTALAYLYALPWEGLLRGRVLRTDTVYMSFTFTCLSCLHCWASRIYSCMSRMQEHVRMVDACLTPVGELVH